MNVIPTTASTLTSAPTVKETIHNPNVVTADDKFKFNPLPSFVNGPVNVHNLRLFLQTHPDRNLVNYLLDGFTNGFSIEYGPYYTRTIA